MMSKSSIPLSPLEDDSERCGEDSDPGGIIHERQSLQLCAIHAVNNLLQLSPVATDDARTSFWRCGMLVLKRTGEQKQCASKKEFDGIANDLTMTENNLLYSKSSSRNEDESQMPSLFERLLSNHRTPYLGNYSFEVLETALQKRGVALSFHRTNDDIYAENTKDSMVVGFVINAKNDAITLKDRVLRVVPGLKCMYGNHWYIITRLRRELDSESRKRTSAPWVIIDSAIEQVVEFASQEDLKGYLAASAHFTIFRATIRNGKD